MGSFSVTAEPYPDQGYVHLRMEGKPSPGDVEQALLRAVKEHGALNRLWDFRNADLSGFTAEDMHRLAQIRRVLQEATTSTRVAALVSRDLEFGMARMFETIAADLLGTEHAVFRDEDEARAWVSR